jgi:hypothetical protein
MPIPFRLTSAALIVAAAALLLSDRAGSPDSEANAGRAGGVAGLLSSGSFGSGGAAPTPAPYATSPSGERSTAPLPATVVDTQRPSPAAVARTAGPPPPPADVPAAGPIARRTATRSPGSAASETRTMPRVAVRPQPSPRIQPPARAQ